MIGGDHRHRIAGLAKGQQSRGDILGIEPVCEFDQRLDVVITAEDRRLPDLLGHQLIPLSV